MADHKADYPLDISRADLETGINNEETAGFILTGLTISDDMQKNLALFDGGKPPEDPVELRLLNALDKEGATTEANQLNEDLGDDKNVITFGQVSLGADKTLRWVAAIRAAQVVPIPPAPDDFIKKVTDLAAQSAIANHKWWKGQGMAPIGYIKGMAVVFARVYCKLKTTTDAAANEMAKAKTGSNRDILNFYSQQLSDAGLGTNTGGPDTLRHLFAALIGLAMPESSGRFWLGVDPGAHNHDGETAEAGLFQTSWNARAANKTLMVGLFNAYSQNPDGFLSIFKEGVPGPKPTDDLTDYGDGDGKAYQHLAKTRPAFAAEFTGVALRSISGPQPGGHWGTISDGKVEIAPQCDELLKAVQALVDKEGVKSV